MVRKIPIWRNYNCQSLEIPRVCTCIIDPAGISNGSVIMIIGRLVMNCQTISHNISLPCERQQE